MNTPASITHQDKVNILLVDDQPAKLMSYGTILSDLGENLLTARSGREALEILMKSDVAVILIDVCMPDVDGFELAKMIREHPRFASTAIIFVSAIFLSEIDNLKGYELGGVDYVSVPVVPKVLQAKVRVFVELHRKTRALERLTIELEKRVEDRTRELTEATVRHQFLAREVDHRARNVISIIQSIVALTPKTDSSDFAAAIKGRISAMARAHSLLSSSHWSGADLLSLVQDEMEPYVGSASVEVSGEPIAILPSAAQSVALALHELATNAAKHGALSETGGKVQVSWRLEREVLSLHWIEDCPFPITGSNGPGFGSRVIEAGVRDQLGGTIKSDWRKTGVSYVFAIPRKHFTATVSASDAKPAGEKHSVSTNKLEHKRILIVDDEPLIAVNTEDLVRHFGALVVGPYFSASAAQHALASRIDAALLDVNLGGEDSLGLAEALQAKGVPIILVTGYQPDAVSERFAKCQVLTKPIESGALGAALAKLFDAGDISATAA